MTLLRSSVGNNCLKHVAQYPSYVVDPHRESGQVMQFGHRLPPPCSMHLSVWLWADLLHPGSLHRLPPPCAAHLSVWPWAAFVHPGSMHRLPPPCAAHLSVWPMAPLVHPGSTHRLPPPCALHLSVLSTELLVHPGSTHRLPPPCALHLSVWPWADLLHPGSTHRLPPPCAAHLSVGLLADLLHPGSVHRLCFRVIHVLHYSMNFNSILTINSTNSTNVMVHVCLFLSSVLKPFDKCIIRMQVNEAIFHTFERSWCQPRFCFI